MRIEHAFGLLKGRFKRLNLLETKRIDLYVYDLIPVFCVASCILHNVCIMQFDIVDNLDLKDEVRQLKEENIEHVGESTVP
jgi:hypothetical protein